MSLFHIHRYHPDEIKTKYHPDGYYSLWIKRRCRCGAMKFKVRGYL